MADFRLKAEHAGQSAGLLERVKTGDLDAFDQLMRANEKQVLGTALRLLGNLDEEYSCANSRFFRTTLYANAEVSRYLHDHFILHWKSVRPVPRITVDFGDGRKIERCFAAFRQIIAPWV